jgi:hypothetical protein
MVPRRGAAGSAASKPSDAPKATPSYQSVLHEVAGRAAFTREHPDGVWADCLPKQRQAWIDSMRHVADAVAAAVLDLNPSMVVEPTPGGRMACIPCCLGVDCPPAPAGSWREKLPACGGWAVTIQNGQSVCGCHVIDPKVLQWRPGRTVEAAPSTVGPAAPESVLVAAAG